jgi:mRNA-degrading endonuclease RelE of RelBE toxin-antitoxin system
MRVRLTNKAIKQYRALPKQVQKKADKQFGYLIENVRHPSLNVKKYGGVNNVWQGRIDKSYRFYFHIIEPHYIIVSIINHPK